MRTSHAGGAAANPLRLYRRRAACAPPRPLLEIDVGERLAAVVADDEAALAAQGSWRRETALFGHGQSLYPSVKVRAARAIRAILISEGNLMRRLVVSFALLLGTVVAVHAAGRITPTVTRTRAVGRSSTAIAPGRSSCRPSRNNTICHRRYLRPRHWCRHHRDTMRRRSRRRSGSTRCRRRRSGSTRLRSGRIGRWSFPRSL